MDGIPRIRPIDAFPVEQDGKTLIYLKDPLNLATPIGISPVGYFILAHFDGQHSVVDIQEAYAKKFGSLLPSAELKMFVDMLDEHYYLQSERFEKHRDAVVEEFRSLPTRAAAHVGGVYQADPVELVRQLDGFFTAAQGPGLPDVRMLASTPPSGATFVAKVWAVSISPRTGRGRGSCPRVRGWSKPKPPGNRSVPRRA